MSLLRVKTVWELMLGLLNYQPYPLLCPQSGAIAEHRHILILISGRPDLNHGVSTMSQCHSPAHRNSLAQSNFAHTDLGTIRSRRLSTRCASHPSHTFRLCVKSTVAAVALPDSQSVQGVGGDICIRRARRFTPGIALCRNNRRDVLPSHACYASWSRTGDRFDRYRFSGDWRHCRMDCCLAVFSRSAKKLCRTTSRLRRRIRAVAAGVVLLAMRPPVVAGFASGYWARR